MYGAYNVYNCKFDARCLNFSLTTKKKVGIKKVWHFSHRYELTDALAADAAAVTLHTHKHSYARTHTHTDTIAVLVDARALITIHF